MKTFRSKKDLWLVCVIYLCCVVSCFASGYMLIEQLSSATVFVASFTFLVGAVLPLWLLLSLVYRIDATHLYIKCGPFNWQIALTDIKSVTPSHNIISSPALSLDRLLIQYGDNRVVLVSPENQAGFIHALTPAANKQPE